MSKSKQLIVLPGNKKLTTNVSKGSKKKKEKMSETTAQKLVRLGAKAAYSVYSGDIASGLSVAYEGAGLLGSAMQTTGRSGPTTTAIAAPTATSSRLSGTMANSHVIIDSKTRVEDGFRLKGQIFIGTLYSGVTSYYLTANGVTYFIDNTVQGDFAVSCLGSNQVANSQVTGYPRVFNPPNTFLSSICRTYSLWRPNSFGVRFVPICPTTTAGSVSLAWRNTDADSIITAGAYIYGNAPFDIAATSQFPAFTTGPAWAPNGFDVNPRKMGVCENANDWLSVDNAPPTTAGLSQIGTNIQQRGCTAGYITINMGNFVTTTSAVAIGYIMYSFDYSFHMHTPVKSYTSVYGLSRDKFEEYIVQMHEEYEEYQEKMKRHKERKEKALTMPALEREAHDDYCHLEPTYSAPRPTENQGTRPGLATKSGNIRI